MDHHQTHSKSTTKAGDEVDESRDIFPDAYGTFPKGKGGVRAEKLDKSFLGMPGLHPGHCSRLQKLRPDRWTERDALRCKILGQD